MTDSLAARLRVIGLAGLSAEPVGRRETLIALRSLIDAELDATSGEEQMPATGLPVPPGGWEQGYGRLVLRGLCPTCRNRISDIRIHGQAGLSWSCKNGCNP